MAIAPPPSAPMPVPGTFVLAICPSVLGVAVGVAGRLWDAGSATLRQER